MSPGLQGWGAPPVVPPRIDVLVDAAALRAMLLDDARRGLGPRAIPKTLPPRWFYDDAGCALYERIMALPEYYLVRREEEILGARAAEIAAVTGATTLIDLGAGNSAKTRLLLEALACEGTLERFVSLDVAEAAVRPAAAAIAAEYPGVRVHGIVGTFERHVGELPRQRLGGRRLIAFLGSTIGNLAPPARAVFLAEIADLLTPGEFFLVGTDLVKDPGRLVAAYDDPIGVTADFNRNVLAVLNRELGADFALEAFAHVARWNALETWMEMRLAARTAQVVRIPAIDLTVTFAAGEELWTEISAKFRLAGIAGELRAAGLEPVQQWTDAAGDFGLTLARRAAIPAGAVRPARG